jgi:hypothetical protein
MYVPGQPGVKMEIPAPLAKLRVHVEIALSNQIVLWGAPLLIPDLSFPSHLTPGLRQAYTLLLDLEGLLRKENT